MAEKTPEKMVLEIETSFDSNDLAVGVKKVESEIAKRVENVRKKTKTLEKQITSFSKKVLPTYKQWGKEGERVLKVEKKLGTMAAATASRLTQLQLKLRNATEGETKAIENQISRIQERYKAAQEEYTLQMKLSRARSAVHKKQEGKEKAGKQAYDDFVSYDFSDAGKGVFEGFRDGVQSLRSKDLGGLVKGLASSLGAAMKGAGSGLTRKMLGGAGGGGGGGEMAGVSKAMGALFKTIGPILNILGKLGPILGVIGGAVAGIVKLMIDAEAAAKDFNRQILETAGTGQFLTRNLRLANAGSQDLGDTLRKIRDDASSLDNMDWGINKETHAAVLASLTAEGVSLKRLNKDFENTGKASKEAAGYAKSYGSMVQMSVAYSRMFGVSLNEISQFQSEMMVELGASLVTTQKQFHMMTKGAEEAGIASNKFFAVIRGVSADLSLYNNRMEDAVHTLTLLGKVMNPKNAQQFLQASMGSVKNMGRAERLKVGLLVGGKKRKEIGEKSQKRGVEKLSQTMGDALGNAIPLNEIQAAIENGGAAFEKILSKVDKEQQGTFREAQAELKIQKTMGEGGAYGQSLALGEMDQLSQAEVLAEAMKKFGGHGKTLAESMGKIGVNQMAEGLSISIDALKQNAKLEMAVNSQRDILKEGFKNGDKTIKDKLSKVLGHEIKDASEIDQLGYAQIGDTYDEGVLEQIKASAKELDYAKDTADFQNSLLNKIENLMEWITNKIYNIMVDIWSLLSSSTVFGGGDPVKMMEIAVAKSKDQRAGAAFDASGGDMRKFRESLAQTIKTDLGKNLEAAKQKMLDLQKSLASEQDPKKRKEIEEQISDIVKKRAADQALLLKDNDVGALKAMGSVGGDLTKNILTELESIRTVDPNLGIENTKTFKGLSDKDKKAFLEKLAGNATFGMSPEALLEKLPHLNYGGPSAPDKKPGEAKPEAPKPEAKLPAPPSEQAKAAARSAAPGTSGAPVPTTPSLTGGVEPLMSSEPVAGEAMQSLMATPAVVAGSDLEGATAEQVAIMSETGSTIADIFMVLRVKGVRIDWKYRGDDFSALVEKGVLEGARTALLEYFLYSSLGIEKVQKALGEGMSVKDIGANVSRMAQEGTYKTGILGTGSDIVGPRGAAPRAPAGGAPASVVGAAAAAPPQKVTHVVAIQLDGPMAQKVLKVAAQKAIVEHNAVAPKR